jgi:hypothetical protein
MSPDHVPHFLAVAQKVITTYLAVFALFGSIIFLWRPE